MSNVERALVYFAAGLGIGLFILGVRITDTAVAIAGAVAAGILLGLVWTPDKPGHDKDERN